MTCDICKRDGVLVHRGTRDNSNVDVYRCSYCGTKFLSVIKDYDYENGFMNQSLHMSKEAIATRVHSCAADDLRRANMLEDQCKGKTVLDFGCGFGGFLKYISKVASEVMGVELGGDERTYLTEQKIPCVKNLQEQNKQWDIITLFHCFEHLSTPREWL